MYPYILGSPGSIVPGRNLELLYDMFISIYNNGNYHIPEFYVIVFHIVYVCFASLLFTQNIEYNSLDTEMLVILLSFRNRIMYGTNN